MGEERGGAAAATVATPRPPTQRTIKIHLLIPTPIFVCSGAMIGLSLRCPGQLPPPGQEQQRELRGGRLWKQVVERDGDAHWMPAGIVRVPRTKEGGIIREWGGNGRNSNTVHLAERAAAADAAACNALCTNPAHKQNLTR